MEGIDSVQLGEVGRGTQVFSTTPSIWYQTNQESGFCEALRFVSSPPECPGLMFSQFMSQSRLPKGSEWILFRP